MPGSEKTHPVVPDKMAADLREAARQARQFAATLKSPEIQESFLTLAAKWEAEAQAIRSAARGAGSAACD
jgi:hypothetical protein